MRSRNAWRRAGATAVLVVGGVLLFGSAAATASPRTRLVAAARPAAVHAPAGAHNKPNNKKKQHAHTSAITISNFKFGPAMTTIKVGATVVWTNKDVIGHSVNFDTINVNSKTLGNGGRFSHTFMAPGTYHYICAIHPFMHGTIVVTA
jgi:plastocyanin